MIGYYVHHHGHGHLHRALQLASQLNEPVVGISSAPAPAGWSGDWVGLDRDDLQDCALDPTAGGPLHWAPLHDSGLSSRMATLSTWLERARPRLLVVDVSVEVIVLARLHGIPVTSVVLPGDRGDSAHRLGFALSQELVGFWPPAASRIVTGLSEVDRSRLRTLGGLSRAPVAGRRLRSDSPSVVVLTGSGGLAPSWASALSTARLQTPEWRWTLLGDPRSLGPDAEWVPDPEPVLHRANVVITHAGQNAVAEVAAARVPAIVVPQERPHDEQLHTARALEEGLWPARIEFGGLPEDGWPERLRTVSQLDGDPWSSWADGLAGRRFAAMVEELGQELDDVRVAPR